MTEKVCLYGVIAEFDDADKLLDAAKAAKAEGYDNIRAYSPFEVHGLADALEIRAANFVPYLVLIAMVLGAVFFFYLQYITDVVHYPINVGGRALNSWQAFMIITFEGAILGGGLAAAASMFIGTNLPMPYHPVFNAPNIEMASRSDFFILIESTDPRFDRQGTANFLRGLEPKNVSEVTC